MSEIKEYTTHDGKELLFVKVPKWAENLQVVGYPYLRPQLQYDKVENYVVVDCKTVELDSEHWQIIGTTDQMSEEECKPLVNSLPDVWSHERRNYKDYTRPVFNSRSAYMCLTAKESFNSLLESLRLDPNKRYVVLEKLNKK